MHASIPTLATFALLIGCAQPDGDQSAKRAKTAYETCAKTRSGISGQMQAAMNYAVSTRYAAEAKASAEKCAQTRRTLAKINPAHPCLPLAQGLEGIHWALAASFEGRSKFDVYTTAMMVAEGDRVACAAALGATPAELASMKARELESKRRNDEADAAIRGATAAAAAADDAAADAARAMAKAAQ